MNFCNTLRSFVVFSWSVVLVYCLCGCNQHQEINLTSLLKEMVNRDQLANFPESGCQCLQASSYNRESVNVSPNFVLPEYPIPHMVHKEWMNLIETGQWAEKLTFVPYFSWDNRQSGKMKVWIDKIYQAATACDMDFNSTGNKHLDQFL